VAIGILLSNYFQSRFHFTADKERVVAKLLRIIQTFLLLQLQTVFLIQSSMHITGGLAQVGQDVVQSAKCNSGLRLPADDIITEII
jgi:hypothetical protein